MKRIFLLLLAFVLLLTFCGCGQSNAVNPLFGVCLMAENQLYVCSSKTIKPSMPLEHIGDITDYDSALPQSNFTGTSNDHGTQLLKDPDNDQLLYVYDTERDEYWIYCPCEFGVVLNGILYVPWSSIAAEPVYVSPAPTYTSKLPDGFTAVGTINESTLSMLQNELDSFGLPDGSELFTGSDREQYIYVSIGNADMNKYLRLEPFIALAVNK